MDLVSAASAVIMVWAAWSWFKTPKMTLKKPLTKWELLYWKDGKLTSHFILALNYDDAVVKSHDFLKSERERDPNIKYAALQKVASSQ